MENEIFFPHTRRCKRGKIRESPLSALTKDTKREREDGETRALAIQTEK